MRTTEYSRWSLALLVMLVVSPPGVVADDSAKPVTNLGDHYGFGPLEIFKLENRSHSMVPGDFNSDGRTDIAIVDNSHSRIDVLLQRENPPTEEAAASATADVNRIDTHWRFEHTKLPLDREVDALVAGDFNNDGKTDLAYFGKPDRLVVRFQTDGRDWSQKWETRLADVSASSWSVVTGDFNHDGLADLVVLGKQATYVLTQQKSGGFASPVAIRNTADELRLGMAGDFDGDGRTDLFYTATSDGERYNCVRLQTPQGTLGPEFRLDLKNSLGVTVHNILGDKTDEILAINAKTERLGLYRAHRPKPSEEVENRPILYGVGPRGSGKWDLDTGDLTGNGLADVVVSDPDSAQIIVYRQRKETGLDLGTAYASFLGVEQLRVRDLNGDGKAEVVVLSPKEKTLGICHFDAEGDRLTFPKAIPTSNEVLALEIADLNGDGTPEIVFLAKPSAAEGSSRSRSSSSKFVLQGLNYSADGELTPFTFPDDKQEIEIEARDVGKLTAIDANGDGLIDLLVTLDATRAPLLLLNAGGTPEPLTITGGVQLADIDAGSVFQGELDGKAALLISQGAFARRMQLDETGVWQVLDQYNAGESTAKVKGAAILDLDGQPGEEIVLVDTGANKLRMFRKEGELYQPWQSIEIGAFPYQSLKVVDLNGDGRKDLLLFGGGRFAVLYTGQSNPTLEELANYESQRKGAFLVDVTAGDLNGDGVPDIVVLDNKSNTIEIVAVSRGDKPEDGPKLTAALNFKVFEEKGFGNKRGGSALEPREMLIADVTGDGLADLLLLIHDRILLYPQDSGKSPTSNPAIAADPALKK